MGRRAALFRETPLETAERVALGLAWAAMPGRWHELPPLVRIWARRLAVPARDLPNPEATVGKSRVAGIVRDLTVPTLVEAYKRGLHSSGHFGALQWESPPERCVLFFDECHMGKRLRRIMRQGRYSVTFDRDFEGVIKACAGRRAGRWHVTWITPRIMRAYADLYDAGLVHSFEVWNESGELVGGGYGVALGRIFFTESQFSREDNTSKLGFSVLNWHLARWGFILNDGDSVNGRWKLDFQRSPIHAGQDLEPSASPPLESGPAGQQKGHRRAGQAYPVSSRNAHRA